MVRHIGTCRASSPSPVGGLPLAASSPPPRLPIYSVPLIEDVSWQQIRPVEEVTADTGGSETSGVDVTSETSGVDVTSETSGVDVTSAHAAAAAAAPAGRRTSAASTCSSRAVEAATTNKCGLRRIPSIRGRPAQNPRPSRLSDAALPPLSAGHGEAVAASNLRRVPVIRKARPATRASLDNAAKCTKTSPLKKSASFCRGPLKRVIGGRAVADDGQSMASSSSNAAKVSFIHTLSLTIMRLLRYS